MCERILCVTIYKIDVCATSTIIRQASGHLMEPSPYELDSEEAGGRGLISSG